MRESSATNPTKEMIVWLGLQGVGVVSTNLDPAMMSPLSEQQTLQTNMQANASPDHTFLLGQREEEERIFT